MSQSHFHPSLRKTRRSRLAHLQKQNEYTRLQLQLRGQRRNRSDGRSVSRGVISRLDSSDAKDKWRLGMRRLKKKAWLSPPPAELTPLKPVQCSLYVHDSDFSSQELVINPEIFPSLRSGTLVELEHPNDEKRRLTLVVAIKDRVRGNMKISLAKRVAEAFDVQARQLVWLRQTTHTLTSVDFVEISFGFGSTIDLAEMWAGAWR